MSFIITLFATCSLVFGIIGLLKPVVITNAIARHYRRSGVHSITIMLRVILGLGLVVVADDTRMPLLVQLVAWMILLTAVYDSIKGPTNYLSFVEWMLRYQHLIFRIVAGCFVLFAGFLLAVMY